MFKNRSEAMKEAQQLANENDAPVCVLFLPDFCAYQIDDTPNSAFSVNLVAIVEPQKDLQ